MQEASDSDDDSFALPKKFRKAEDTGPKKKTKKERKAESSLAQEYDDKVLKQQSKLQAI